jgi:hypothetical protein
VELYVIARSAEQGIDTKAQWGVAEAEARALFETAYRGQVTPEKYASWLGRIGRAVTLSGALSYRISKGEIGLNAILEKDGRDDHPWIDYIPPRSMSLVTYGRKFDATRPADSREYEDFFASAIVALGGRAQIGRVYRLIDPFHDQYQPFRTVLEETQDATRLRNDRLELASHLIESKLVADFLQFTTVDVQKKGQYLYIEYGPLQTISDAHDQIESQLLSDAPELQIGVRTRNVSGQPLIQSTIGLNETENSVQEHDEQYELLEPKAEASKQGDKEDNPLLKDLK